MIRRLDGRDEPILDPRIPIIDAHHHLFDLPSLRYMFDEYLDDCRAGHRIVASIYSETKAFNRDFGPSDLRPLGEIEFANGIGAMSSSGTYGPIRICAAIVGNVDLRLGDGIGRLLDRAMATAPERFRGMRQIIMEHPNEEAYRYFFTGRPPSGIYDHPSFRDGLRALASRGLSFDATGFHTQLPEIGRIADDFPDMRIILNHLTVPMPVDSQSRSEALGSWSTGLRDVARRPNVTCKVGGFGMPIWGFGFDARSGSPGYLELAESWRPMVETAIETFGAERCMLESNYPPDGRSCGFVPLWNALKHIVRDCSASEKRHLFYGSAARVYDIDLSMLDMSGDPLAEAAEGTP